MKLTELEPQFLRRAKPLTYVATDAIREASALGLRCPACHWSFGRGRTPNAHVHRIMIWRPERPLWGFAGTGPSDLSLAAPNAPVAIRAGCGASFWIRDRKAHV